MGAIDIARRHVITKEHADIGMRIADYPTIQVRNNVLKYELKLFGLLNYTGYAFKESCARNLNENFPRAGLETWCSAFVCV